MKCAAVENPAAKFAMSTVTNLTLEEVDMVEQSTKSGSKKRTSTVGESNSLVQTKVLWKHWS